MAKSIAVLGPDQAETESPRYHEKKSIVCGWVRRAEAVWIVKNRIVKQLITKTRKTIEELLSRRPYLWDGPLGIGNLLPFAKPYSDGAKLHYEIPRAGDRSLFARHHRRSLSISARNQIWPASGPQFRTA